jgi:hypothetical protein
VGLQAVGRSSNFSECPKMKPVAIDRPLVTAKGGGSIAHTPITLVALATSVRGG